MSPQPAAGRPTVQLLHELPDGSCHVDWMIAQDPRGRERLTTFRLPRRLDELTAGQQLEAVMIDEHRPRYLTYEGPIGGDRGVVRRLAAGEVLRERRRPDAWELEIRWLGGPLQHLRLLPTGAASWVIVVAPAVPGQGIEGGEGNGGRVGFRGPTG